MPQIKTYRCLNAAQLLWGSAGVLSAFWIVCAGAEYICRRVPSLHLNETQYTNPFLNEHFIDFLIYEARFQHLHTTAFFAPGSGMAFMYPSPVAFFYEFFYSVSGHPLKAFLEFIILSLAVGVILFGRSLRARGVPPITAYGAPLVILALSFPVWFELRQANMEIVVWAFVAGGLALFLSGRGYSAAACFGFAAAMKIYPAAYLGLLLIRRQYRQIVWGLSVAVLFNLAGLRFLCPSIHTAWRGIRQGLAEFRVIVILHKMSQLPFDHSLLSLIKLPLKPFPAPEKFGHVVTGYLAIVAIAGVLLFFFRVWRLPVTNQILFLTIACILFPPVSYDYTLLHLLAPFALLVLLALDFNRSGKFVKGLYPALACCLILLAPLSEIFVDHARIGGQVKALTLLVLLILAVTRPLALPGQTDGLKSWSMV